MGVKHNSRELLLEIGGYLTRQGRTSHLRAPTLAYLLDCSPAALAKVLEIAGLNLNFQVVPQPGLVSFAPLTVSHNEDPSSKADALIRRIETLLEELARAPSEEGWLVLADLWEHAAPLIALESLPPSHAPSLLHALEFLGFHVAARDFWIAVRGSHPELPPPDWAMIRGVAEHAAAVLPPETRQFTEVESNHTPTIRAVQDSLRPPVLRGARFYLDLLLLPLLSFARLVLWRGMRGKGLGDVRAAMGELARDSEHWRLSSGTLASYWLNVDRSISHTASMAWLALRGRNPLTLLRAVDWWLFTSAHRRGLRFSILAYRLVLIPYTRRVAPFLAADQLMHLGILLHYRGDCLGSLHSLSLVEARLGKGNHPFNRNITLSNALRTAVSIRTPRFTHAIYFRILENAELNVGLYPFRTKLSVQIHRSREDGSLESLEMLRRTYEQIANVPPFSRGSFEVLMALAYLEAGEPALAATFNDRAAGSFETARTGHAFRGMLRAIRDRARGGNRWRWTLSPWGRHICAPVAIAIESTIPRTLRAAIAVNFHEPTFCSDEQLVLIDVADAFFSAPDEAELAARFRATVRTWLPEFRFAIQGGSMRFGSEAPLPHDIPALMQDQTPSRKPDAIFRLRARNEVEWTYFTNQDESRNTRVVLGAPTLYRKGGGNRFLLANSIVVSFVNALNQICARRKQIEFEKEKANSNLGRLASQVSHDIRSPLAALNMVVGTMNGLPDDSRLIIRSATQRINDIANDLLQRSRGPTPTPAAAREETLHLFPLLDSLLTEKRLQYRDRADLEIQGELEPGHCLFVRGRTAELARVVSNLVNNAAEAITERGNVWVRLEAAGEFVRLEIEDNGRGIPPELLNRLGEQGLSHGKEGSASGTGLGIPHAMQTIRGMRGRLEISSVEGKGTCVRIWLLRSAAPSWFLDQLRFEEGQTIVVLDDDTTMHQIWRDRLGPDLRCFATSRAFEEWQSVQTPDLHAAYLFDHELSGSAENGLELINRFALGPRAVLVTSRAEDPMLQGRAEVLGVKILPKALAPFASVRWSARSLATAIK